MSTNCIVCHMAIDNLRTGSDLMCDDCRKVDYEKKFRATYRLKKEFRDKPECQAAFDYAAAGNELNIDEINYVGEMIERISTCEDKSKSLKLIKKKRGGLTYKAGSVCDKCGNAHCDGHGNYKPIEVNHEGIYYPVKEENKSIVINGNEYILPDEVWGLLLCLDAERDYFKDKYLELTGVKISKSIN